MALCRLECTMQVTYKPLSPSKESNVCRYKCTVFLCPVWRCKRAGVFWLRFWTYLGFLLGSVCRPPCSSCVDAVCRHTSLHEHALGGNNFRHNIAKHLGHIFGTFLCRVPKPCVNPVCRCTVSMALGC